MTSQDFADYAVMSTANSMRRLSDSGQHWMYYYLVWRIAFLKMSCPVAIIPSLQCEQTCSHISDSPSTNNVKTSNSNMSIKNDIIIPATSLSYLQTIASLKKKIYRNSLQIHKFTKIYKQRQYTLISYIIKQPYSITLHKTIFSLLH